MEIRDLQIFLTVAKEGSISGAAEKLGYVQSSVSIRIQELEHHLKTPLFYRQRRGVRLTPAGEILKSYAERILFLAEEAERVLADRTAPRGPLRIGSLETTSAIRLPNIIYRFTQMYPDVELSLKTGTTTELVNAVLAHELDGAFVAAPVEHTDLDAIEIGIEELVLVFPSNNRPVHQVESLQDSTLLVFRLGCSYRHKLENWLHQKGIVPKKIMEFGTLEGILGCVSAGLGITLLPRILAERAHHTYRINYQKISDELYKTPTLFIRRKDGYLSTALSEFIRIAQHVFAQSRSF